MKPASVLYMSMSLDGYIAGPNDNPDNPGGDVFMRLHEWYGEDFNPEGPAGAVVDEERAFGAIVAGRRTVEDPFAARRLNWPGANPSAAPPPSRIESLRRAITQRRETE